MGQATQDLWEVQWEALGSQSSFHEELDLLGDHHKMHLKADDDGITCSTIIDELDDPSLDEYGLEE